MADVKKTILLELGINKADFLQEAADTQKQISDLTARQKELKAAGQEASLEYQNNVANLKLLKDEYREAQRNATNFEKALQEGADESFRSLSQLQAELSVLTSEYKSLSEAGRQNSEEGKRIQQATADITAKLKEQEQAVGNFRRNVGNYPSQIVEITQKIKQLTVTTENADFGSAEFQAAAGAIKVMQGQLDELIHKADVVPGSISEIKATISALKDAKLTVPLEEVEKYNDKLLELETTLQRAEGKIDEFGDKEPKNSRKKAMDDLNDTIGGTIALGSALTVIGADEAKIEEILTKVAIANTLATNAKAIAKASTVYWSLAQLAATKALIPVTTAYNLVVGQSTGAMKLFRIALASTGIGALLILLGLLISNFTDVKNAVTGFLDRNKALKTSIEISILPITLLWQGLKKVGEYLGIVDTEAQKAANSLRNSVGRTNEGLQYQIDLLGAKGDKQTEIHKLTLKQIDNELNARRAQMAAGVKLSDDEMKEFRSFQSKRQVEVARYNKWVADEEQKKAEDAKKKSDEAVKKQQDEAKKREEASKALNKKLADMEFELNQKLKSQYDQDIADHAKKFKELREQANGNLQQLKKIAELEASELAQIREKRHKAELEKQNEYDKQSRELQIQRLNQELVGIDTDESAKLSKRLEILSAQRDNELADTELTETQKAAIKERYAFEEQQAKEEYRQFELEREKQHQLDLAEASVINAGDPISKLAARQEQLNLQYQMEVEAAEKLGQDLTLITAKYAEQQKALDAEKANTKLSIASGAAGNMAQIFGKESKLGKAAATTQTTIDTYQSATAAYKAMAGIPIVGPVLGGIAAAAAVASGLASIRKINETKEVAIPSFSVKSFSTGGMAFGPGTGTSDSISARLSNGEAVINAKSTAMFRPLLSAINVAGGGVSFSSPNYSNAFATGGVYDGGYAAAYNTPVSDANAIGDAVSSSLIKDFPEIWVNVADVNSAQAVQANVDERVSY
ncbi:hypothetical protein BCY91_14120 [Pelobium manganitolerans]|uniref:Uncharacterized protein n=1 Tax=Pelobium manganitolerans TaxID=1842495 RepID=A0A419S9U9_9SPHI|nr:hypothetical protein [Pelobium manganitolerans]RKD19009.1 hypothetical protein BCY91_14120 [Pelobium manganitolerans]